MLADTRLCQREFLGSFGEAQQPGGGLEASNPIQVKGAPHAIFSSLVVFDQNYHLLAYSYFARGRKNVPMQAALQVVASFSAGRTKIDRFAAKRPSGRARLPAHPLRTSWGEQAGANKLGEHAGQADPAKRFGVAAIDPHMLQIVGPHGGPSP
jgi:hypothetical protein